MFGGQQPSLFGAPTSQPSAFGGFGTTTTFGATTGGGGGLFGQTQTAQPTFGGTSAFGATAFGQPQQQSQPANPFSTTGSAGFGATSNLFGGQQTTQPAQSTGMFGNSGLFGAAAQPAAQTTFGQPQQQQQPTTGLFGASSTGGSLFGQPKSGFGTGTTFGAQQTSTPSLFGGAQQSSQPGGLFGSSGATTTGTGLFGQQSSSNLFGGMAPSQSGTTVKFVPVLGSDAAIKNGQQSTVTTKNYCICTMKEYNEQKSQEELRLEDYQAGRKFGTTGGATTSSMFGAAGNSGTGGLFGSTTASPFAASSAFGQPTAASKPGGIFGAPTAGMFGQPAQQPAPATNFFGGQTATPATGFGQSGSLFAQPAASTAPSLFGGFSGLGAAPTTTTASTFGTNTFGTTSGGFGGFGQNPAPATTNMFGQPAASTASAAPFGSFGGTSSLFAAKPAVTTASTFGGGFGAAAPLTGFGGFPSANSTQPATNTGSLFGGGTKPLFGTTTTSTTPFGGLGGSTGFGGFGAAATTQPTTGMFGQNATSSTGLFGSSQPLGSSFFGTAQPAQLTSSGQSSSGGNIHAQVVEMLRQGVSDTEVLSNMYAQLPMKEVEKKPAPLSAATINAFINNAKNSYAPAVGSSRKDERTYNYYVAPTHKVDGLTLSSAIGPISWRPAAAKRDERFKLDRACIEQVESEINKARMDTPRPVGKSSQIKSSVYTSVDAKHSGKGDRVRSSTKITPPVQVFNVRKAFDQMHDDSITGDASPDEGAASSDQSGDEDEQSLASGDDEQENRGAKSAVILKRPDYYTIPDMSELVLDEKGQCIVSDFYIGRYQCGGVQFLGNTNVAGLNLDALITISDNEVVVYPDERKKPPVGKGLNKKAIITFENVRPQSTDDRPLSREEIIQSGFEEMLRARIASTMEDAEFLAYKPESGQVSFIVKHFSKYKLVLTRDDVIVQPGKRRKNDELPPLESAAQTHFFNSDSGNNVDLAFENVSKGSEDSLKENMSPLIPRKRRHHVEENENESENFNQSLIFAAEKSGDIFDYFDRVLPDEIDEPMAVPTRVETNLSLVPKTRRVLVEYGNGAKSITGALTFAKSVDVMEFLASVEGQFLSPCSLQNDLLLTEESKEHLEEMMQLYLSNCDFEKKDGQIVVLPPVAGNLPDFVDEFCHLAENLPGSGEFLGNEKIVWSLFRTLYGEIDVPEAKLCEKLLAWLKETLAFLQPSYANLEEILPENATKAIFEAVLAGRNDEAVDISLHFGLFDVAMTILALERSNNEQSQVRSEVWAVVDTYLDHVIATVDENSHQSTNYLTKTLMLLGQILRLRDCLNLDSGSFSVCQGLDWLQCLAACALHLPNQITSGMWDILREYKEHASRDPHCAVPDQTSDIPKFIFSMLSHFCRHSLANVTSSLDFDLLNEKSFDVRIKWFLMRMYGVVGDALAESTQLEITSNFSKILQNFDFSHLSVVALLHLNPEKNSRKNEIHNILLSLVKMAQDKPDIFDSIVAFLSEEIGISREEFEEIKAVFALTRGDKLTALEHFFAAKNAESCKDIITNYLLPLLASADSECFSDVLQKCEFFFRKNSEKKLEIPEFSAFFQLLKILEEWKTNEEISSQSLRILDEVMDVLGEGSHLVPSGKGRGENLLHGFIRQKIRNGRALLVSSENF